MIKHIITILVLLMTVICYGQNLTLIKNTHPKARELKHNLNTAKDSLILDSETKILKVDIFNEDYEEIVLVEAFTTQIPLKDLPEGKFVIETKLTDKIIVMDLIKYQSNNNTKNITTTSAKVEGKGMMIDEGLNIVTKLPSKSIESILTGVKIEKQTSKRQKFYWTLTKINNESGSSKTMKLVSKASADRMILKHQQELNSVSGKRNELTIWEVYNTSKFMAHQLLNPEFFCSANSDLFNTIPYYKSENTLQNL